MSGLRLETIMPPKKKKLKTTNNESEDSKSMVWTDDEVELVNIKSEKSYEGINWASIKEKYETIQK